MFKYEEAKRPDEEGRMTLEVATNGVPWAQELNTMSLSDTNLTTAENGEDTAPHYRDHYEFPNLTFESQS